MNVLMAAPLLFTVLLLERSYGGYGEGAGAIVLLIQGFAGSLVMTVLAVLLVKLSSRADELHRARYRSMMKMAGIVIMLFVVVYALASIGSR